MALQHLSCVPVMPLLAWFWASCILAAAVVPDAGLLLAPASLQPRDGAVPWTAPPITAANRSELRKMSLYAAYVYGCAQCLDRGWDACVDELRAERRSVQDRTRGAMLLRHFNTYNVSDWHGSEAFLAVHHADRQLVLSFAGTSSWSDWINNLQAWPTRLMPYYATERGRQMLDEPVPDAARTLRRLQTDVWVHSGFHSLHAASRESIMEALLEAFSRFPDYELALTGHSLGGALGTLMLADLRFFQLAARGQDRQPVPRNLRINLYTYGMPRVANDRFAAMLDYFVNDKSDATLGAVRIFRVTNSHDAVPLLPPRFLGYRHYGPHQWLDLGDTDAGNDGDNDGDSVQLFGQLQYCPADIEILTDDNYAELDNSQQHGGQTVLSGGIEAVTSAGAACQLNGLDMRDHGKYFVTYTNIIGTCRAMSVALQ